MRTLVYTLLAATALSTAAFAQSGPFAAPSAPLSAQEKAEIHAEAEKIKRERAAAAERVRKARAAKEAAAHQAAEPKHEEPMIIEKSEPTPSIDSGISATPAPMAPAPSASTTPAPAASDLPPAAAPAESTGLPAADAPKADAPKL